MKSEPDVFSIDHLMSRLKQTEHWDGVRNYKARNYMRAMQLGDLALFYHSSTKPPGVAGLMQITKTAGPDPSSWDPKSKYFDAKASQEKPIWSMVEVTFKEKFPQLITLDTLKALPAMADSPLVQRGNRLSILPLTENQFKAILSLK